MFSKVPALPAILATIVALAAACGARAQEAPKPAAPPAKTSAADAAKPAAPKPPAESPKPAAEPIKVEADPGEGAQQYCANIASAAVDARIAWQMKKMSELEAQLKQATADLEAKEAESKDWVEKRDAMMRKADDNVVAIYSKMDAEAAAAQLVVMEDDTASAILSKLNPRVSSAILNQMEAARAAKLTDMISGAGGRKKS